MKKAIIWLVIWTFHIAVAITFENTIGGSGDDIAYSVKETSGGGYIIAGSSQDSLNGKKSMTLIKIDHSGNEEWRKITGGGNNEGFSAIETKDGSFVIAGFYVFHINETDSVNLIYIEKTDSEGNTIWTYEQPYVEETFVHNYAACEIIQTKDGGYASTGSPEYMPSWGSFSSFVLKLDSLGIKEWFTPDSTNYIGDESRSIVQTEDNGYVFTGQSDWNQHYSDIFLYKTDSIGNFQGLWIFGGTLYYSMSYSLKYTLDKGFVILGSTYGPSISLGYLIKTDENCIMEWDLIIGDQESETENSVGKSIDVTADGGYILTGNTEVISTGKSDIWLIKCDAAGNILWKQTFGMDGDDRVYSVQQTTDGGYILAGYTDSFGSGGKDIWIIKTDENGTAINNPLTPQTIKLHQNYPNPFNPYTKIWYNLTKTENVNLSVFNSKGELVQILSDGKKEKGLYEVSFNASELNSGIYFYKLTTENSCETRKMLLLK